jgi:hypothetical protein
MYKILSKQSMIELSLSPIQACLPRINEIKPLKITSIQDREMLSNIISLYQEYVKRFYECENCNVNLKRVGCVCDFHYHDLALCHRDECLRCFLTRSGIEAFPQNSAWQDLLD